MIEVRDNPDRERYEIFSDGTRAGFAQYVMRPQKIVMVHTEIDDAFSGHGLGSKLAMGALDDIRVRGLRVVPLCPFIARYIEQHPEYDDLVDHAALAALA